jgi:hypothetical protein
MNRLLFPTLPASAPYAWSTYEFVESSGIRWIDLDDKALNVCRVTAGTSHNIVIPPPPITDKNLCIPPAKAWEAVYPQGSINPKNSIPGGFGFYFAGPSSFRELLKDANEVLFSYSVMFANDWSWVKGGKLPGIC